MAARGREDRAAWTPATRPEPTVRERGISFAPALPIRVVFAEDNYLVREGVVRLLGGVEDVELVAVCEDAVSLRAAIDETEPDVIVTDIRMPPSGTDEGIRIADEVRDSHPEIGVVVLSQFLELLYALALLERGAAGRAYLLKGSVAARPPSARQRDPGGRRRRLGRRRQGRRDARRGAVALRGVAARRAHAPAKRSDARGDGARKVECRDRASARDHGALGGEGDPFDLPEARAYVAVRHQPTRQARACVPVGGRVSARPDRRSLSADALNLSFGTKASAPDSATAPGTSSER